MPIFMCRWPNADLSFVSARNKEDAIILLDEWGNAELAELRQVQDFMVDFGLTDDGELELKAFGEGALNDIWERAYPVLSKAKLNGADSADELTEPGREPIREAVRTERQRLRGKRKGKPADTEIGKTLQGYMDAPAALVNRQVKQVATQILKKSPGTARKQ
ncbi:MAG: hypothetical protein ABSG03_08350 [Bryobacteraceae bacterium]